MGFYKNVVNRKEGDLLRVKEDGPVYIWYKEHWQPLPRTYQEVYATLTNMELPKSINISKILHMLLEIEIHDSNRYIDSELDKIYGVLQNNSN